MRIPFLSRVQTRKIVLTSASTAAQQAARMLATMLDELPELQLGYVFDLGSSTLLASYTVSTTLNPHYLTLRNAKVLHTIGQALASQAWPGGACTDLTVLLDTQLHYLRPLPARSWYCFVATQLADANLGLVKEVVRRATS